MGYNVGSWFGFLAARYMLRNWFLRMTADNDHIRAISNAVEESGIFLVFLLQIAPVLPYSMVCYFFGTSSITFFEYAIGTAVGVIPCIVIFVLMVMSSCCKASPSP